MDRQKFVKSQQATRMLRQVEILEEPYLSNIAEELDTSYHALKKYMDAALDLNLVEKSGKKGKKQLLQNNWSGYIELYAELWSGMQEEFENTESFDLSDDEQKKYLITDYQELKQNKDIINVLKRYFKHHLIYNDGQNLEKILVDDLATAYLLLSQNHSKDGILREEDLEDIALLKDEKFIDFITHEMYKYIITKKSGSFSLISALASK